MSSLRILCSRDYRHRSILSSQDYKDTLPTVPRADAKELKQAYQDMARVEAQLRVLDFELASSTPSANDSS